jgi:hypothetical protein
MTHEDYHELRREGQNLEGCFSSLFVNMVIFQHLIERYYKRDEKYQSGYIAVCPRSELNGYRTLFQSIASG